MVTLQSQLIQMQQLSQEQEEIKEQQKLLMQQQERILKEQDALRQREVFIRKIFYDASANMAVADHMVSAMINQSSHVISPMVRASVFINSVVGSNHPDNSQHKEKENYHFIIGPYL